MGQNSQLIAAKLCRPPICGYRPSGEGQPQATGFHHIRFRRSTSTPQHRFDPGQQNGDIVRLGDIVIPSQAQGPQLIHRGISAGDQDDGNPTGLPQVRTQGEAIPAGQAQIQQNQVRAKGPHLRHHLRKLCYRLDLIPLIFQQENQLLPHGGIVFYNRNLLHL